MYKCVIGSEIGNENILLSEMDPDGEIDRSEIFPPACEAAISDPCRLPRKIDEVVYPSTELSSVNVEISETDGRLDPITGLSREHRPSARTQK